MSTMKNIDKYVCAILKAATVTARQVQQAARQALLPASAEQAHAGNYRKGHISMHGLSVTIENPAGSLRKGTDANGKEWSVKMKHHYGYLRRTQDADGDQVDVFIGPNPEAELVYVINQERESGRFDEHKCMLGFLTKKEALDGYLANYAKGWNRYGEVVPMTMGQFKEWLKAGDTERRVHDE